MSSSTFRLRARGGFPGCKLAVEDADGAHAELNRLEDCQKSQIFIRSFIVVFALSQLLLRVNGIKVLLQ